MKIMHVAPYFQPNMGYQENYLPRAQKALGHEVELVASDRYPYHPNFKETMKWSESDRIVGAGHFEEDGIDVVRLRTAWEWGPHWWVYLPDMWQEIERFNPDVIHIHCINGMLTYQILAGNVLRNRNVFVDDHNNYFNKVPFTWKKWCFYRALKYIAFPFVLWRVRRFLAMSHEVVEYLHTEFGIPRTRITLNHLGADPEEFKRDEAAGKAVRAKYGIPEDAVVIVNAGKITPVKDNHILLEALAKVVQTDPRAYLIMIGNAPADYRAQLNAIIEKHHLESHVTWLEFLPHNELTAHYSASDIGCWPGDWSCTVIEAAACNVALVQPDLLYTKYSSANDNSLNFKRGDIVDLAEKLTTLVQDNPRRNAMRAKSRELIETRLNWDALAKETLEIYQTYSRS